MALTKKQLILIGFIIVLLIGIPLALFVVQQQQEIRSRAEKATILYYEPESSQSAPLQKQVGDVFTLDIYANPQTNLISSVRLEILYDETKLATASAGGQPAFVADPDALANIAFGPAYTPGKIAITITAGADPTKALLSTSKIGSITFEAIETTDGGVTEVKHGPETLVTSGGDESQFAENVLASANPAFITILDGDGPTRTPTPTDGPDDEEEPTPTNDPEDEDDPDDPEGDPEPTLEPEPTATPTATPTPEALTQATATPTLAPSGPGEVVVGFGIGIALLTILGGILFFAL